VIGRTDILIDTPFSREETLALCARRLASLWRDCVFEDAETGEVYRTYHEVPFGQTRELFGYRDPAAYASWEELGADEANANTMVHLLCYEARKLTVVVDDEANPEMRAYIDAVHESLAS
jgi:hypothetical protein